MTVRPALIVPTPANRQRDVGAGVIKRGLAARERQAVVAAHDDDGVVQLAALASAPLRAKPGSGSRRLAAAPRYTGITTPSAERAAPLGFFALS